MQNFKLGIKEDLARNYRGAIEFYTKSVETEEMILDAHLNLIVIMITVCFDFGLTSSLIGKQIYTESDINELGEYLNRLLQKSAIAFNFSEISFWKYYKENYYSGYSRDRVNGFLNQPDSNLIPYFQLYVEDLAARRDVSQYKNEIQKLKNELQKVNTIKNEYILSLIQSAEHQARIGY